MVRPAFKEVERVESPAGAGESAEFDPLLEMEAADASDPASGLALAIALSAIFWFVLVALLVLPTIL